MRSQLKAEFTFAYQNYSDSRNMIARISIILFVLLPAAVNAQVWTLDSCISYAFQNNLAVKISEQSIKLSEINETTAWGSMLPSLNAQGGHGYNWGQRIDPFTNQFASSRIQSNNFGIATGVNIFGGFQQYNTWRQAEINTDISKKDYEKARNDLALNITSAYLNILVNKEYLQIAQQTLQATTTQVERIEKLVIAGQLAQGNLSEIRAQQAADNASLASAMNFYKLSKLTLMQLLQLDMRKSDSFDIVYPNLEIQEDNALLSTPSVAIESALNSFPEIKSAQLKVVSADYNKKIARGGYSPSLSASFSYGTGYSGAAMIATGAGTQLFIPVGVVAGTEIPVISQQTVYEYKVKPFGEQLNDNINRSLFFTLNVPLFNGFNTRAASKRAEINVLNAELQLEQSKQQLEQAIYQAHADALAALATYESSKTSVEASQKSFDWVKTRFEAGAANSVEYNDALIRLQNAQATLSRSKYEYIFKLKLLEFYEGKTIRLK